MRRAEEHDTPYFVDRVPWTFFATASLLLVLTLIDGLITVALLDHGCEEANPFMAYLLNRGTNTFLIGKYVLTATLLPVALVMNHYRLFGTRLRVGHLIPIVAVLYLILIAYQAVLWDLRNRDEADDALFELEARTTDHHISPLAIGRRPIGHCVLKDSEVLT